MPVGKIEKEARSMIDDAIAKLSEVECGLIPSDGNYLIASCTEMQGHLNLVILKNLLALCFGNQTYSDIAKELQAIAAVKEEAGLLDSTRMTSDYGVCKMFDKYNLPWLNNIIKYAYECGLFEHKPIYVEAPRLSKKEAAEINAKTRKIAHMKLAAIRAAQHLTNRQFAEKYMVDIPKLEGMTIKEKATKLSNQTSGGCSTEPWLMQALDEAMKFNGVE